MFEAGASQALMFFTPATSVKRKPRNPSLAKLIPGLSIRHKLTVLYQLTQKEQTVSQEKAQWPSKEWWLERGGVFDSVGNRVIIRGKVDIAVVWVNEHWRIYLMTTNNRIVDLDSADAAHAFMSHNRSVLTAAVRSMWNLYEPEWPSPEWWLRRGFVETASEGNLVYHGLCNSIFLAKLASGEWETSLASDGLSPQHSPGRAHLNSEEEAQAFMEKHQRILVPGMKVVWGIQRESESLWPNPEWWTSRGASYNATKKEIRFRDEGNGYTIRLLLETDTSRFPQWRPVIDMNGTPDDRCRKPLANEDDAKFWLVKMRKLFSPRVRELACLGTPVDEDGSEKTLEHIKNQPEPVQQELFAGGAAASTPGPRMELIPTIALERLAARFERGIELKGDKSWNALSTNQQILLNADFVLNRIGHAMHHLAKLRDKVREWKAQGAVPGGFDIGDDDSGAVAWAGMFFICATDAMSKETDDDE